MLLLRHRTYAERPRLKHAWAELSRATKSRQCEKVTRLPAFEEPPETAKSPRLHRAARGELTTPRIFHAARGAAVECASAARGEAPALFLERPTYVVHALLTWEVATGDMSIVGDDV